MVLTIIIAVLCLFSLTDAQESQLNGPQNTLSVVGSNVTLKCSSPSKDCNDTEWLKYGGNPLSVFNDRGIRSLAYRDRYSVDDSSGCDLVIKNIELTDAGRFICRVFIPSGTLEKTAYLIIMKKNLTCATNASLNDTVEKDGVQLTCEVTYNGTNNASMVWEEVKDTPNAVENGKTISRCYSIVASAPKVLSFTCNTSFVVATKDVNATIQGLATNMPVATCETPAIKVKYSVRNVQLSPSLSNLPPGTVITCSAKGNPSPTFKWQEMENGATWMDIPNMNSSEFSTNDASSMRYRCFAMNVVRGSSYNATSMEFQVNNSDDSGSVTVTTPTPLPLMLIASIGAGIGVGILLLLIITLVVCFCVRSCPGYRCCHAGKMSNGKIREMQPLTENNPDIYSNIEEVNHGAPKAKPRSAPTSEPPKLPKGQPPQAKPRTDNPKKAGNTNAAPYVHEEVTYADLALESGQRQVIPKNNQSQPETLYAAVGTA